MFIYTQNNLLFPPQKNSMALVRERTIPTERPPPVGEFSANFCGFPPQATVKRNRRERRK